MRSASLRDVLKPDETIALQRSLWKKGFLAWLLYKHQREMYYAYKQSTARKFVFHCSRRLGKSVNLLTLANEVGMTQKQAIIRYGAANQKDVREIILPLQRMLTESCPTEIRPVWNQGKGKFIYPATGSELVVSGLDEGRADNLRGASMHLGIIDEAGFVDDLDYVIRSILMPQLLTTDGRLLLSSTSPRSSGHSFVKFLEDAKLENAYIKKTIHEDSRPEVLARIPEWMKESGGEQSTSWRREYLCEIITDEDSSLVPEFTEAKQKKIIQECERPPFFIPYSVTDLGLIDHTATVFGYVDFLKGKNVIEDEFMINHQHSKGIVEEIRAREIQFFGESTPVRRFIDGPALTVHDMNLLHKMDFVQVDQHDPLDSQLNTLRLEIQAEAIAIHPRCVQLLRQLKYGVWDKNRRKFDRISGFGHFDLVAALMYFVRHTNKRENPYPLHWGLNEYNQWGVDARAKVSKEEESTFRNIFNLKE